MAIRVVLAEDSYLVREGIRRLLGTRPEVEVVATCDDLASLLAVVQEEKPDVVLTDIRMPPDRSDEGIQAARQLRELNPGVGVVVLQPIRPAELCPCPAGERFRGPRLSTEGARGGPRPACGDLTAVAAGGSVIDPKVVESLVASKTESDHSALAQLTPREHDVLREMARGKNNLAIAEALVITERSVEKYVHSIFAKLGLTWEENINRRVKAVLLFLAEEGD